MTFQGNCSLQTSDSLHLFASPSPHLSQPWASRDLSDAVADHPKGMEFFHQNQKVIEAPGMELGLPQCQHGFVSKKYGLVQNMWI